MRRNWLITEVAVRSGCDCDGRNSCVCSPPVYAGFLSAVAAVAAVPLESSSSDEDEDKEDSSAPQTSASERAGAKPHAQPHAWAPFFS